MPHFFFKMIPPKPTFAADLTDERWNLMLLHTQYWMARQEKGEVVVFGQLMGSEGAYGIGIISAADEAGARAFAEGDPITKAGFRCEISPIHVVTRDSPLFEIGEGSHGGRRDETET
jgi:uncharacterized protein YciI